MASASQKQNYSNSKVKFEFIGREKGHHDRREFSSIIIPELSKTKINRPVNWPIFKLPKDHSSR